MATPHGHWWVRRDLRRLIARCEFTSGGPIDTAELRYLRITCEALMVEILPLSADDRVRVEQVHHDVLAALAERASARIEMP